MSRHPATRLGLVVSAALVLLAAFAGSAHGEKRYVADRFDVHVRLEPDGTTRVTETVVFRFEGGAFTQVRRELPLTSTDGIDLLAATLDGAAIAIGGEHGDTRLSTSRRENRLRAVWHFPPTEGTHTFSLTYLVRGLVEAKDEVDRLQWAALPRDHDYPIAISQITFEWPAGARLWSLTADQKPVEAGSQSAVVERADIRKNRSVTLRAAFAPGTAAPRPAGWQERVAYRRQMAPTWVGLAIALFAVVSALFWFFWARSPRPAGREAFVRDGGPHPPDLAPPAFAGALVAKGGRPAAQHSMGGVLELARRGMLRIEERPSSRWTGRKFVLRREGTTGATASEPVADPRGWPAPGGWHDTRGSQATLRPHERAILHAVFVKKGQAEDDVPVSSLLGRLVGASAAITRAVREELGQAGLLDHDRLRSRRRMMTAAAIVLGATVALLLPPILLADQHGGWPFLLPLALALSSLVGFILAASIPAQTDEGVRQGERWKRYGEYLRRVSRKDETAPLSAEALPYAVAFGAGGAFVKALHRRGAPVPAWFHAASAAADQQSAAFVALMTTTAASGSSTGSGSGSGAAGGGSSGAS